MEHEISAFYDITHARSRYSHAQLDALDLTPETAPRFAQYGVRVWHLNPQDDVMKKRSKGYRKNSRILQIHRPAF